MKRVLENGNGVAPPTNSKAARTNGKEMENGTKKKDVPDKDESKTDFREYYSALRNQQNMLEDHVRTACYHNAIMSNRVDFEGKVVLDVGAGSGILSIFAAQAGAKKVYSCEASSMSEHCKELVKGNGLQDTITVIEGKVEDIRLPEKVDVIVSEPLGVLLVHERMIESYYLARDKFLKPDGQMVPRNGTIKLAPFSDVTLYSEQTAKGVFWNDTSFYGVNLTPLRSSATKEHFEQPVVGGFSHEYLMSSDESTYFCDFLKDPVDSLLEMTIPFRFVINKTDLLHGIACWFDCSLGGTQLEVTLATGPASPITHWQQCRLMLHQPIAVNASQIIKGTLYMKVNEYLSYDLKLEVQLEGYDKIASTMDYRLQNQYYRFDPLMAQQWQQQVNAQTT